MASRGGRGLVEGKVALVTGAARGIGRATARLFAREGARVVLGDRLEEGEAVAEAIRRGGGEAVFVRADVTREPEVEALVGEAVERFGRLDCAHNNAGITGGMGPVQDLRLEDFERTLRVNLLGVFLCLKHELRVMQRQGAGAVVNTSSGSGLIATPGLAPYCASKHGVLGLTKTAALENARTGVRVNAVLPGSIDTPMLRAAMDSSPGMEKLIRGSIPSGRLGTPEEVAEAVVWLCSDRASLVSGASLLVDGATVNR